MRRLLSKYLRLIPILLGAVLAGRTARCEGFLDFSLGAAFTSPTSARLRNEDVSTREDIAFEPAFGGGVRAGAYFDSVSWFGLCGDLSAFRVQGDAVQSIDMVTISPLLLFRVPLLATEKVPGGRIQPYLGLGPALALSNAVVRMDDPNSTERERISGLGVNLGLDVRVGLATPVTPWLALFAEYRFTAFDHLTDESDFDFDLLGGGSSGRARMTLLTHHVLVGVSFRF